MNGIKGWLGEKKTSLIVWLSLSRKTYRRFNNVIIPSKNGTTQIDHLIISPFGVFIIETKNKKGWIFGSANKPTWTQVLYDNRFSFQNPFRQTYRQKKILSAFLDLDESKVHPIVYFVGDCKFKTPMPGNVIRKRLASHIKRYTEHVFSTPEVERIISAIEKHLSESDLTSRDHRHSLRERLSSTDTCPKCGSKLVERSIKNGPRAGETFLGCESFPNCRFSRSTG
ncbi:MAG: Zn-finger domain associated with topoisomerase type I [Bacteroidetes bacterium HLUCCA01]|nr:MAG: Zn-finger domain associated with topoisomerase type I [Bacteroidetes bacterium HLUCCA01]